MYPNDTRPLQQFTPFPIDFLGLHNRLVAAADTKAEARRVLLEAADAHRRADELDDEASAKYQNALDAYKTAIETRSSTNG